MVFHRARNVAVAVAAVALLAGSTAALADLSSKVVQKEMKGQLIVTAKPLAAPDGDDRTVVKALKKAAVKSVKGFASGEVKGWNFAFIAFLKKAPGKNELSLDFYTDDKEKLYVANKRLTGIDPKLPVLEGQVDITEDDGVNAGKSYVLKLVVNHGGKKETLLATTKLTLK